MPRAFKAKKLVLVLATIASVTGAIKGAPEVILDWVPSIHYPVQFRKDKEIIRALINFGNKVNAMTPAYTKKLGFQTQKTYVGAQKIDGLSLNTFGMVIASF